MASGYLYYIINLFQIFHKRAFRGWGRRKTGRFASWCYKKFGGSLKLCEDGFIRSVGLGVDGVKSLSRVVDDVGIYYDATCQSRLEILLREYDFAADQKLMEDAKKAIALIKEHHISKYNGAPLLDEQLRKEYGMCEGEYRVLIIAQTKHDASLEYGMLEPFTTEDMIEAALAENPHAKIYLKLHPDVLCGKKSSDIEIKNLPKEITIMSKNINPLSLLKAFDKVYTKTSGMGFEALLVGCECVCFGMPFYAGWGVTQDRSICQRRGRILSIEEIFSAAYILYTHYFDPATQEECDIFKILEFIQKEAPHAKKI